MQDRTLSISATASTHVYSSLQDQNIISLKNDALGSNARKPSQVDGKRHTPAILMHERSQFFEMNILF
jgi:hypothetical protein